MKKLILSFVLVFLIIVLSCNNSDNSKNIDNNNDSVQTTIPINQVTLKIAENVSEKLTSAKEIDIEVMCENSDIPDSVQININDKYFTTFNQFPGKITWDPSDAITGTNTITAVTYKNGSNARTTKSVILYSDIIPLTRTYKIIKTYPHDKDAYTQGLFIHDGILYEATGLKGHSTIRKTKLETGDVIQSYTISADVFGEGITLFDDKIIQLSWQDNIAYIYEMETFKQVGDFEYYTEGWGLTNDGKNLIMSDGTNKLYFIETQSYSVVSQLEVYDNEKAVNYLNELEYVDGIIYANIYTSDLIAAIDAKTGKVQFYTDLSNILSEKDYEIETDVLNGIAYDFDKKKLYVTGKKWPKLFEIQII